MTTLLAVYNSDGCVGRCDERCYDAKGDTCTCICGGKNHKAGKVQAERNTAEMVLGENCANLLEQFCKENNIPREGTHIRPVQLPLMMKG